MFLRSRVFALLLATWLGGPALLHAKTSGAGAAPRVAAAAAPAFLQEPVPAWVQPAPADPGAAKAEAPTQYLVLDRQTRAGPGGEERFVRRVTAINELAGLQTASQLRIDFDPSYETLVLHRVEVLRGAQRLDRLDRGKVRLLQRETQLEQQMVDGHVTASLVLDDLRVGDRIEVAYTLRGANPVFGGRFVDNYWMLPWQAPAALIQYRLLAPEGRAIGYRIGSPDVEVDSHVAGGMRETVFRRRAAPRMDTESGLPRQAQLDQRLELSEFADWAAVAQWAQGLFKADGRPMPGVKAQAAAIAAATPQPMQRLQQALDFVQKEVRYFATESGVGSHRPAPPDTVLARRYGDCKDKVLLLVALLRELGVTAVPVLASLDAGTQVDQRLPSPLAFNHALARVDAPDGSVAWLDATRAFQAGPVGERQALGLGQGLVAGAGAGLVVLPSAAEALHLESEDTLQVASFVEEPELRVRLVLRGDAAEQTRGLLASDSSAGVEKWLLQIYRSVYPTARLAAPLDIEPDAAHNRVGVVARLALPDYWSYPQQTRLNGRFGFPWLLGALPGRPVQRGLLQASNPGVYRQVLTFEYDEHVPLTDIPARIDESAAWVRLQQNVAPGKGQLRIETQLHVSDDPLPAAQLPPQLDRLKRLGSHLVGFLGFPPWRADQSAALQAALRDLEDRARRGQAGVVTQDQLQARAKLLMLDAELDSGLLNPRLRAEALLERGIQLDHLGRTDSAQRDFELVVRLRPDDAVAHAELALNALMRRQDAVAVQEAQRALALAPGDGKARFTLARARYELKDYAGARRELDALLEQPSEPDTHAFARLWQHLTARRAGQAASPPMPPAADAWPLPLLQALTGTGSIEQATAAAQQGGRADPGRLCELYFYLGEQALIDGDARRARELYRRSVDTGVTEFIEYVAARRRLDEMGR